MLFDGLSYVITTSRDIEPDNMLRLLLKQKINVRYFRDISRSVKQLFEAGELE